MKNSLINLQRWLTDPTIAKLIEVAIGIVIITIAFRFISQSLPRYIQDSDTRYRTRKTINFIGYIIMLLFALFVFSDRLGQ
ncbi:MAG: mechanosensitive ion channel family protein, partial [Rivularia sp. ALOHA_DT_140]|nr:mechanosensitive ion channel family protein [Rivularia sp. ALOHA_DT_140]